MATLRNFCGTSVGQAVSPNISPPPSAISPFIVYQFYEASNKQESEQDFGKETKESQQQPERPFYNKLLVFFHIF